VGAACQGVPVSGCGLRDEAAEQSCESSGKYVCLHFSAMAVICGCVHMVISVHMYRHSAGRTTGERSSGHPVSPRRVDHARLRTSVDLRP
jgi:hypothetical protein